MKGRTSSAVLGPLASEPVGEVLEMLMDKGLALRHHWWHLLNNYPAAEKKETNSQRHRGLAECAEQVEPGGAPATAGAWGLLYGRSKS